MIENANYQWQRLLGAILDDGAARAPRGMPTLEVIAHQSVVPMSQPVVTLPARKMGYRFLAAESAWILSGDNRVSSIAPYSKEVSRFSDDGVTFFGAYGPRFVDQVQRAAKAIATDPDTRQAVATLWRPNPPGTKDVPCTVALQWLLRGARLHCVATMRSSDAWLGWVYDVHSFSMMSARVLLGIRHAARQRIDSAPHWSHLENATLGNLYLTAGSQHLYERDYDRARECVNASPSEGLNLAPFDPDQFEHPDELATHLWKVARREDVEVHAYRGPIAVDGRTWLVETL